MLSILSDPFPWNATVTVLLIILDVLLFAAACIAGFYFGRRWIKTLRSYITSGQVRKEKAAVCRSLGEALKEHRIARHMTQEFVAEHLGVSRQAVSKWENGTSDPSTSDPSTSNLLALAKLFEVDAAALLNDIRESE